MADNVAITAGVGTNIASDDIGGVQYQRVKVSLGADGAAADLAPGQAEMANSVPVAIANNQSAVPVSGTFYQATQPVSLATAPALVAGTAVIGTTMDGGPSWTTVYTFTASTDATGGVDITAAPTGGQKIVVTDILISTDTAMYVSFLEETSGTEVGRVYLSASGLAQITPRAKWKLPVADKKLRIDASVAGNVAVTCWYYSEA